MTSINIPDSVTSIGDDAFYNCRSLKYNVYDNAEYLGNAKNPYVALITASTYITSCDIHNDTKVVGDWAFYNCSSLTSITIPDSVTSIGISAFSGCSSLTSVTIGNGVTSIGERAFFSCTGLTSIEVSANNTSYKSIDGNLYTKDGTTLIQYAVGKRATTFTIPDSVTSIGYEAFKGCSGLTIITIPDSVTSIGISAFSRCSSLTSVTIGNSVTSIGDYAFYKCSSLTSITFNGTVAQWKAITKGSDWKYNVPATKVVCIDGEVAL